MYMAVEKVREKVPGKEKDRAQNVWLSSSLVSSFSCFRTWSVEMGTWSVEMEEGQF